MSMTWWVRITYTDTPFSSGLNVLDNASDRWKQDDEILVEPPLSSLTVEPLLYLPFLPFREEEKKKRCIRGFKDGLHTAYGKERL